VISLHTHTHTHTQLKMEHHTNCSKTCSRGISRIANELIEDHILPVLKHVGVDTFPESCPYASGCFRTQEKEKHKIRRDRWECGICGKLFKSERHIDRHLDYRHTTNTKNTFCISDACSHLRCHTQMPLPDSLSSEERVQLARVRSERCDELLMQSRRSACEDVARLCFESETLRSNFLQEYCLSLTCSRHDFTTTAPSLKRKLDIPDNNHTFHNIFIFFIVFGTLFYYLKLLFLRRRRMSADGLGDKIK